MRFARTTKRFFFPLGIRTMETSRRSRRYIWVACFQPEVLSGRSLRCSPLLSASP
jgi:hypothetical protein